MEKLNYYRKSGTLDPLEKITDPEDRKKIIKTVKATEIHVHTNPTLKTNRNPVSLCDAYDCFPTQVSDDFH